MIFKRLNRTSPEQVFAVFKAVEAGIAADDVVALDSASPDGVGIEQPTSGKLAGVVGVADAAIASGAYGLVQIYGYRSTSRVRSDSTSIAAFVPLKVVADADYLLSEASIAGSGQIFPSFVILETAADNSGSTLSKKIFIRCM